MHRCINCGKLLEDFDPEFCSLDCRDEYREDHNRDVEKEGPERDGRLIPPQGVPASRTLNGHDFHDGAYFCYRCGTSISAARDPDLPCVPVQPMAVMA